MEHSNIKNDIIIKFIVIGLMIAFGAVMVIGQIVYLQTMPVEDWEGSLKTIKEQTIKPLRGDICARDGRILATSMPLYTVHWDLTVVPDSIYNKDVDSLAKCLSRLLGNRTPKQIRDDFDTARKHKNQYYTILNKATVSQVEEIKKFPIFKRGKLKGGFIAKLEYIRNRPLNAMASRTIGYINETGTNVGMEGAFNDILSGRPGVQLVQKLATGEYYPISTFDDENRIEPEDGKDIISTIDITIQDLAEINLRKQLISHNAKYGSVIVMEVKTGKIRAIVNLDKTSDSTYSERYNHAVGTKSVPGSTFKLATLIVALEKGIIDLEDTIDTGNGQYTIGDFTITDDHKGGLGKITLAKAFAYSSNVAFAKIVKEGFRDRYEEYVNRLAGMNLEGITGIEIKGEVEPVLKSPGKPGWSGVTPAQMGIGYEVEYTPLQILTFYNAVANNGNMLKPTLLEAVRSHGKIVRRNEPEYILNTTLCSRETIKKAQKLLQLVVDSGTAKNLKTPNYKFAGKTGTAQIAKDEDGKKSYQASFVGYFPADNPKYSCIVVVSSPTEISYYGNSVAGPVFKAIADKLFATDYDIQRNKEMFNLVKNDDKCLTPYTQVGEKVVLDRIFSNLKINVVNAAEATTKYIFTRRDSIGKALELNPIANPAKGFVPNVVGMGARDAVYNLEKHGIKVTLNGRGTVKKQSVTPGTKITSGMKIVLDLS